MQLLKMQIHFFCIKSSINIQSQRKWLIDDLLPWLSSLHNQPLLKIIIVKLEDFNAESVLLLTATTNKQLES